MQPYRQHTIFRRSSQKLSTRYFGPFQVLARIGTVAYRLKLPDGTRVHPVFHVSLLKKRLGSDTPAAGTLPPLRTNGQLKLNPKVIIEYHTLDNVGNKVCEALVKWQDLPIEEATWECIGQLRKSFPTLNLEDKILFESGCNDGVTADKDTEVEEPEAHEPNQRMSN